jgi:hypothetical protein
MRGTGDIIKTDKRMIHITYDDDMYIQHPTVKQHRPGPSAY